MFSILNAIFMLFFQTADTVTIIQTLGFPIVVCLFCAIAFRSVWSFFVEQMRCKDELIKNALTTNTDATKAQTQMLMRISEILTTNTESTNKQTELLINLNKLFNNKDQPH
jgi:predicted solute-binding protein